MNAQFASILDTVRIRIVPDKITQDNWFPVIEVIAGIVHPSHYCDGNGIVRATIFISRRSIPGGIGLIHSIRSCRNITESVVPARIRFSCGNQRCSLIQGYHHCRDARISWRVAATAILIVIHRTADVRHLVQARIDGSSCGCYGQRSRQASGDICITVYCIITANVRSAEGITSGQAKPNSVSCRGYGKGVKAAGIGRSCCDSSVAIVVQRHQHILNA